MQMRVGSSGTYELNSSWCVIYGFEHARKHGGGGDCRRQVPCSPRMCIMLYNIVLFSGDEVHNIGKSLFAVEFTN